MTVGELIAKLQTFDPNRLVLVDAYEGGYDVPVVVERDVYHKPRKYMGTYQCQFDYDDEDHPTINAVIVGR